MRKIILLLTLGIILFPMATYAGTYGSLKGKVVDDEGNPVIGATVVLKGTTKGANTKAPDGKFTILNISPGQYTVKVTAVGYQPREEGVIISIDLASEISVKISSKAIQQGEIIVTGKRKLVENERAGPGAVIDAKQIQGTAREGVTAIVSLTTGVSNSGNGYNIRGSRDNETQIRLEGLDVGNQFTGGFGSGGTSYYPMVSSYATEEVQVLTGSFTAEYGETMGGLVNSVVSKGHTDKYTGYLRYRTEFEPLWGSQANGLKLERFGTQLRAVDAGPGAPLKGTGEYKIEAGINGPIPLIEGSTFYLYPSYQHQRWSGGYQYYDPAGNDLSRLDNNQIWVKNITGGITFGLTKEIDFTVGGMFGMTNAENNDWGWYFSDTKGSVPGLWTYGIEERIAKQAVINQLVANAFVRVKHKLDDMSFYEFTVSNTTNNDESSKRANLDDPGYFSGFELVQPTDQYKLEINKLVPGRDKMLDVYQTITKIEPTIDGYQLFDVPQVNPYTGYIEGQASTASSRNPYGLTGMFNSHGNDQGLSYRKGNYWQIDGNYNLSIDGDFGHFIKTGFETRIYKMGRHYNAQPWDGQPFFDVYTDEWGGNIYIDKEDAGNAPAAIEKSSKPYKPFKASAYIMDQIKYKNIIFNPGLRVDYFDANAEYRTYSDRFVVLGADSGFAQTKPKFQISPRLSVTYPITERSNVTISYGLFFKTPELQYMYDAFNQTGSLRGNSLLGNPNIDPQRSTQYNVSYSNALTDDIALSVQAYYKDIYNQVGVTYIPTVPDAYFEYTVAEYGNARGIEVELTKRPTDHIGIRLNYALSSVLGTSSSPTDNYARAVDPYTQKWQYPLAEYPQAWDRTHKVNFILDFVWGDDQGPSIGGIHPIENTQIDFTTVFQTGTPYTRLDKNGNAVGEINAERRPDFWRTDMRLTRGFNMKDIIGDVLGSSSFEIVVDVYNLFNRTVPTSVYSRTGDPDDDGVNFYRTPVDFAPTPYYKEANYGVAESFSPQQYNLYGERYYSENSDIDHNGVSDVNERFQRFVDYLELSRSFRGNYQAPRQVYVGIMYRF